MKVLRKFLKILKRTLLILVLLVLLLYGLLHLPSVQTWLVKRVTANLSEKLHTKVTVQSVDFSFFNKMLLEGLMVEDQHKDTLLYAGTARVRLTDWFFIKDKITLNYVGLDDAIVNMKRTDSVWNYQFIADYFSTPASKDTAKKKGVELNLGELHCTNIRFNQIDKWYGRDLKASLKKLDLVMDPIDYANKHIRIKDIYLEEPMFYQADYTGNEPPDNSPAAVVKKIAAVLPYKWNNSGWTLELGKLALKNGRFMLEKETDRAPYVDRFDGQHLFFSDITGEISNVRLLHDTMSANVALSTMEKSGLEVKKLNALMKFTPEMMEFNGLDLVTNRSRLHNYYAMRYSSFTSDMNNFIHNVILEAHFKDSEVNSDDLALFAPELKSWKRIFYLEGNAKGTIDNFSATNVKVKSGNSSIDGDIALRGLPDINSTFIDFKANSLLTNYRDIVSIIPSLRKVTQPQFSKLGNIYYKGNFTGFLNDFVTYGTIQSGLGTITADVNMKLPDAGVPSYSGNLSTTGFKIGEFLANEQLGKISLNGKVAGKGFTLDKLNANFNGSIQQLEYGGYNYQHITVDGNFDKKLFKGHLTIDDPNLKINNLNGSLSLSGKEIAFNLDADLQYANLKNINLANDNLSISGLLSLNFTGNNIDNFLGTAKVYSATLQRDTTLFSFDSLTLSSSIRDDKKYLTFQSNDLEAEVSGKFSILQLPDAFRVFLSRYYPTYIKAPGYKLNDQDFSFMVKTKTFDQYVPLLDKHLSGFNNTTVSGKLNLANNELNIHADVPLFGYDNRSFSSIKLQSKGNKDTLVTDVSAGDIVLTDSLHFPDSKLQLSANNDITVIHLKTSAGKTLNDAELNASVQTLADGVKIHFFPSAFIVNDKKWFLEKDGELTIRDNYLSASEIKFLQGQQRLSLSTEIDGTGSSHIVAKLEKVNMGDFLPFVITKPEIKGLLTGTAVVRNPFGKLTLDFTGQADSLSLNGKYIGKVLLNADANTSTGDVKFKAIANDSDYVFNIDGNYNYKDTTNNPLNVELVAGKINLNILEPYLGNIFSSVNGFAQTKLQITTTGDNKYITGDVFLDDGSVQVAYTQCRYLFSKQKLQFNKDEIDLGILNLKDTLGNTGVITGKMEHHFFDRFSFNNMRFETAKMALLHTTKKDNSSFYGNVIGSARMSLNGPTTNMIMNIDGQPSALDSSHIYLPTGAGKESSVIDYIEFVQFGSKMEEENAGSEATNILVNMNLKATPSCKVDVILDEETGDIIKGQGQGDLTIRVGSREPLTINGRYELTAGEYTFNFQTFLKRPFTLSQGGSITWNGDPYQAIIDIEAKYLAKNVDISSLKSTTGGFKQKEDVTIISHLRGILQKPIIDFEFRFDSKSPINSDDIIVKKLADFKNDPNEMYKQVASLLLFNSFISADQNFISGEKTVALAGNTIGGVISGWLTNMFNKQLQKATNGVLSINIDIDPTISLQKNASQLQANVRARLSILLSKRLNLLIGGNLDYNNPYTQLDKKGLITPDITIEWLLNKDGSLRVVGFNRTSVDLASGQRNRSGIQLSYHKDVDKISDIFKSKKKVEARNKKQ